MCDDQTDNSKDLDLQFAVAALKAEVQDGLAQHIKYATACRKFDTEAEQVRVFLNSTSAPSPSATVAARSPSIAGGVSPHTQARSTSIIGAIGRSGSLSIFSSATAPGFPRPYTLTAEDRSKWSLFVPAGEELIATALVNKPNPVGKALMRQIVLTSGAKLIYIDVSDNTVKGTIDVSAGRSLWPIAKTVSDIVVLAMCRVYVIPVCRKRKRHS
jgi:hypothetical protein